MEIDQKNTKKWLNDTTLFFIFLIVIIFIVSIIGDVFNWEASYIVRNEVTGVLDSKLVSVESLFSREGIRYIIGSVVSNFINFKPLAIFLFVMIGIGFAEKTGLFAVTFESWTKKINKFWLTFIVVLISILSNIIGEVAFTLLIPISAILFLVNNRNPIAAIFASYVGITAGTGINFIASQLKFDSTNNFLVGAKIIEPTYTMGYNSGFIFEIVGTILLAFLITIITEKLIVKKLAKYKVEEVLTEDDEEISKSKKRKALILCLIVTLILFIFFIYMLIPTGAPLSGLLLDYEQKGDLARIFSPNSYVAEGLSFIILAILILCGWIYGSITGTLKNSKGTFNHLYNSLNNLGGVLMLLFVGSQLIALFQKTNLGLVTTIHMSNFIENLNISGLPLILIFFVLLVIVNIIDPSSINKISILSPIVVPEFMKSNITPEFLQMVYKLGETTSDIITPMFPYFVVLLGVILIYSKKNDSIRIRDVYKILLPYFLLITLFWIVFIVCWYVINVPISQGILPTL